MPRVIGAMRPRYAASANCAAGSTTLPQGSLYAGANGGGTLLEVCMFNNGATSAAKRLTLQRLTTAGTQGTGMAEAKYREVQPTANCTAVETHTVGPTLGALLPHRPGIGSAAQAGSYMLFPTPGIEIPVGTANGVGLIVIAMTGNADITFVWEE